MKPALETQLLAEALGSTILLATVVGSGIMAWKLADGNAAIALLGNTIPTGAILVVLILVFGPVSGAHFNPIVSFAMAMRNRLGRIDLGAYITAQVLGAIFGVWLAHAMFDLPVFELSTTVRSSQGQWIAEATATFGLLLTIFGCLAGAPHSVPFAVGLYITAAYWFTASTAFANPSVTIARSLTDTFAGIAVSSAPAFIVAQCLGGALALTMISRLWSDEAAQHHQSGPDV
ncbi:MAG: MIP/aquaporin family protein [Hyphomicrobiaceae bacterium]